MGIPVRESGSDGVPDERQSGWAPGWSSAPHAFYLLCLGVAALALYGENLATATGHLRLGAAAVWLLATLAFSVPKARHAALAVAWAAAVVMARTLPLQEGFLMITLGMAGTVVPPGQFKAFAAGVVAVTLAAILYPSTRHLTLGEAGTVLVNLLWPMVLGYAYHLNQVTRRAQQEAIRQLEAANRELARYAAEADEVVELRTRTAMARDLHDTLGHSLSAVTIELEAVRRLVVRSPGEAVAAAAAAQSVARQAMADLRDFVGGLRQGPATLDHPRRQLERLATEAARRSGWRLELALDDVLPPEAALVVPVVREALTNAERHAQAKTVTVMVRAEVSAVTAVVQDDGDGFATPADPPTSGGHWGLVNMRERIEGAGGTLSVESQPGQGTKLVATVPVGGRKRA
ncbi:MAG: sensor histidine kinase [Thermaerobacter sp.]|nr:sensor histidine kinase [Thermaerobacter sp.]